MDNEQPVARVSRPVNEEHPAECSGAVHKADEQIEHTAVRYESQDVRFGRILGLIAIACCVLVVIFYAIWQFFWFQERAQEAAKQSPYPMAPRLSAELPPEPRLEQIDRLAGAESSNADERLAAKEKALHQYGPTEDKGFVHIPIEQAIKATAETLPARTQSPGESAKGNGLVGSGESNSGRMFRRQSP